MIDIDEKSEDSDIVIRNFFIRRSKNQTAAQDLRVALAKIMHTSNALTVVDYYRTSLVLNTKLNFVYDLMRRAQCSMQRIEVKKVKMQA